MQFEHFLFYLHDLYIINYIFIVIKSIIFYLFVFFVFINII